MRKQWSSIARAKARERFWKPVLEMANVMVSCVENGDTTSDEILSVTKDWIDLQLFGRRWNSPVFRNALLKVLRSKLLGEVETDTTSKYEMWLERTQINTATETEKENKMEKREKMNNAVEVVIYKGEYCLVYKQNASGFAQMLDVTGKKMSGTPKYNSLEVVKTISGVCVNGYYYAMTKIGVVSCNTGNITEDDVIVAAVKGVK